MKYALVNNEKVEATKGNKGVCPICGADVIAKCGNSKINHWAHKTKQNCDAWWENETPWHRNWKNNFPIEWQEVIFTDDTSGEKHIADICTDRKLIIEFQHSAIKPEEKTSRENFYKNMLWVVDGTRLKNDYFNFTEAVFLPSLIKTNDFEIELRNKPTQVVSKVWRNSKIPIILDFLGTEDNIPLNDRRHFLFCILPIIFDNQAVIIKMTRNKFINKVRDNSILNDLNYLTQQFPNLYKEAQLLQKRVQTNMLLKSMQIRMNHRTRWK